MDYLNPRGGRGTIEIRELIERREAKGEDAVVPLSAERLGTGRLISRTPDHFETVASAIDQVSEDSRGYDHVVDMLRCA
jgi:hypothetical protein